MSALFNFVDKNADTLQQMALLAYVKDPEMGEPYLDAITTYKVKSFVQALLIKSITILETYL